MTECYSGALPMEEQGPLMALGNLRLKHRKDLALLLNPRTALHTDWTALADRLGFTAREIREIERRGEHDSPTLLLLQDLESRQPHCTVNDLVRILKEMERLDAVDVLQVAYDEHFHSCPPTHPPEAPPPSYSTLCQSSSNPAVTRGGGGYSPTPFTIERHPSQDTASPQSFVQANEVSDSDYNVAPTLEPRSPAGVVPETLPPEYDVYLSYSRDDCHFALEVKERLIQAGKSVYDYEEDCPLGNNIPVEKGNMIVEGSRKMVVILSPSYVEDKWCKFEASLAKVKSPDCCQRSLIPILYRECALPNYLKNTYYLDYQRYASPQDQSRLNNHFWPRLVKAI